MNKWARLKMQVNSNTYEKIKEAQRFRKAEAIMQDHKNKSNQLKHLKKEIKRLRRNRISQNSLEERLTRLREEKLYTNIEVSRILRMGGVIDADLYHEQYTRREAQIDLLQDILRNRG